MVAIERLCDSFRYKLVETVTIDLDPEMAEFFMANRGIEGHRLARQIQATAPGSPITFLKWPDGTDLLADGNHRYVAACIRREKIITAKIVPLSVWRRFAIVNIPQQFDDAAFERYRSGWSGIE